jgi:hypothetical protein
VDVHCQGADDAGVVGSQVAQAETGDDSRQEDQWWEAILVVLRLLAPQVVGLEGSNLCSLMIIASFLTFANPFLLDAINHRQTRDLIRTGVRHPRLDS